MKLWAQVIQDKDAVLELLNESKKIILAVVPDETIIQRIMFTSYPELSREEFREDHLSYCTITKNSGFKEIISRKDMVENRELFNRISKTYFYYDA
jgi:hypothetical protein